MSVQNSLKKRSFYLATGVFAMLLGLIVVPVVSFLSSKSVPSNVDEMFECYNTEVTVTAKSSLED